MSHTPILYSVHNGLGILRVNRPQARNALDWAAQEAFAAAVESATADPTLRVLIITGTGAAFVAGGDLRQLAAHPEQAAGKRLNGVMGAALAQLPHLPCPVIGAVNGDAAGGGVEILTACDLRIAVPTAAFHLVQVRMGLTTGWGGAARLVRLVGQSRALDWMLNGRSLSAAELYQLGFLHRLTAEGEDVLTAAQAWAAELSQLPRAALAGLKQIIHHAPQETLAESYAREQALFTQLYGAADNREAIQAFLEKRPPRFD